LGEVDTTNELLRALNQLERQLKRFPTFHTSFLSLDLQTERNGLADVAEGVVAG
jgi:hypothetical protein